MLLDAGASADHRRPLASGARRSAKATPTSRPRPRRRWPRARRDPLRRRKPDGARSRRGGRDRRGPARRLAARRRATAAADAGVAYEPIWAIGTGKVADDRPTSPKCTPRSAQRLVAAYGDAGDAGPHPLRRLGQGLERGRDLRRGRRRRRAGRRRQPQGRATSCRSSRPPRPPVEGRRRRSPRCAAQLPFPESPPCSPSC